MKFKLIAATIALVALCSCKKDEEPSPGYISLDKKILTLHCGDEYQFTVSQNPSDVPYLWSSSDDDIAGVDNDNVLHVSRIGKATVTVKTWEGSYSDKCQVNVIPYSNLCIEPTSTFGATKSYVKNYEKRTLFAEENYGLLYRGENNKLRGVGYLFDQNYKLRSSMIVLTSKQAVLEEADVFLWERYYFAGVFEDGSGIVYTDGSTKAMILAFDDSEDGLGLHIMYLPYSDVFYANSMLPPASVDREDAKAMILKRINSLENKAPGDIDPATVISKLRSYIDK